MIKIQDIGEVVYGGAVLTASWWDNKRITAGTLADKELFKKASFYTYLGIGLPSAVISAFGWWKGGEAWLEHISHGFYYDLPRFIFSIVKSLGTTGRNRAGSDAVAEANRVIAEARRAKQLGAGRQANRSYQEEFETVAPFAF